MIRFDEQLPQHQSTRRKSSLRRMSMSPRKSLMTQFDETFSTMDFQETEEKKCSKMLKVICFLRPKPRPFTAEELEQKMRKMYKYCLTHNPDSYRVHLNRIKGLAVLDEIIERAPPEEIKYTYVMSLVWCSISCVHHFHVRLRVAQRTSQWSRKRQMKRAIRTFEKLMILLTPDHLNAVLQSMIIFYTEAGMWNTEYLCAEMLKKVLLATSKREKVVHAVLDVAEKSSLRDIKDARQILRVLYEVLEHHQWYQIDEDLMMRLLTMYHRSVMPEADDEFEYGPLRKGLEVCLRHIMENISKPDLLKIIKTMLQWTFDEEVSDEALLDFGNVLEYASRLYTTDLYRESLTNDIFPLILQLVASENRLHSLLGNRVLQHLMDRHNNKLLFDTPRIFFEDTHFNVILSEYNSEDKSFIKKYREMIHATLLASMRQHGVHRINLESTYTSIATILVEVPCGYTAAAVVCLAMAIQENTLQDETIELECTHRLHATVMAIMSLVCWVHNAEIFYVYLNMVLAKRAKFAPHLNPPLKTNYQYAQHHVLWNKPELFFEDWEVRYGLWKCFRSRRNRLATISSHVILPKRGKFLHSN